MHTSAAVCLFIRQTDAKSRENLDTRRAVEIAEKPCKWGFRGKSTARLKIVVSSVRVPVSPSIAIGNREHIAVFCFPVGDSGRLNRTRTRTRGHMEP
jgi:hypothetical protein